MQPIDLQPMSHNRLDFGPTGSLPWPMEPGLSPPMRRLSTTQIGALGEAIISVGLMHASQGRLSPFKPLADDHGTDLLLFDKDTQRAFPLQIKCRTGFDDQAAQTVQFDVRLKMYVEEGDGFILAALLDQTQVHTAWLFSAREWKSLARLTPDKGVIVPSAKPTARDKFQPYRHTDLATVAQRIVQTGAQSEPAPRE